MRWIGTVATQAILYQKISNTLDTLARVSKVSCYRGNRCGIILNYTQNLGASECLARWLSRCVPYRLQQRGGLSDLVDQSGIGAARRFGIDSMLSFLYIVLHDSILSFMF